MASVTFKRGTKAEIENTQIQDGQLLMETDQLNNNKIYLDLPNGTRVPVGGSGAWVGTKEEFELAVEEGKIADGTQVIITDDYESGITASMTLYSNAQSGLVATNVQSAIDEVSAKIGQENISQVGNSVTGAINNLNSNFNELRFIKFTPTINSEYATGYVIAYSIYGKVSLMAEIIVTKDIPKWTHIIEGLPSIDTPQPVNMRDINNNASVQYHKSGFIQSINTGLAAGTYVFNL